MNRDQRLRGGKKSSCWTPTPFYFDGKSGTTRKKGTHAWGSQPGKGPSRLQEKGKGRSPAAGGKKSIDRVGRISVTAYPKAGPDDTYADRERLLSRFRETRCTAGRGKSEDLWGVRGLRALRGKHIGRHMIEQHPDSS